MRMTATLKDIARMVGVSATTVSYVLNNNPKQSISAETAQKIIEAAKKLNYVPNNAAKALRLNQTFLIGVAVNKNIVAPRISQVIQGIRDVLAENEYDVMFCSGKKLNGIYPDYLNKYYEGKIDGIIYLGNDNVGPTSIEKLEIARNHIPTVVFDCKENNTAYSSVDIDYFSGAYEIVKYLLARGAQKVIYLRPELHYVQEQEREAGVRTAMDEHQNSQLQVYLLPINDLDAPKSDRPRENTVKTFVWQHLREQLNNLSDLDAIICSWGATVEIVLSYLQKMNRSITIAGLAGGSINPIFWDNVYYSPLPNYDCGNVCANAILSLLKNPANIDHYLLKPSL